MCTMKKKHALRVWISENNWTVSGFMIAMAGQGARVSQVGLLYQWLAGQRCPSLHNAVVIDELTGGEITPRILVEEYNAANRD